MNKKNNRKGFTIVELVIVIAVIAILATVLVPTFGDVISKAQTTSAVQEAKNLYTNYVANFNYESAAVPADSMVVKTSNGKYIIIIDGAVEGEPAVDFAAAKTAVETDLTAEAPEGYTRTYAWDTEAEGIIHVTITDTKNP
jgi:type IV pilus assembly protein PilA